MDLRFGFLDADNIGILFIEPFEKSFPLCGANSIGVASNDFEHCALLQLNQFQGVAIWIFEADESHRRTLRTLGLTRVIG